MNKVYRVVWNASLGAWVAVSELAKSKSKSTTKSIVNAVALAGLVSFSADAFAAASNGGSGSGTVISSCTATSGGDKAANSVGSNSVAIGCNAEAGSNNGIYDRKNPYNQKRPGASGTNWVSGTGGNTAIGSGASAGMNDTGLATAIGTYATASNTAAVAIGVAAMSTGNTSLALGRQSAATKDYAQAIGNVAAATGKGSLAVGHSATSTGNRSIAIGSADIDSATSTDPNQQGTDYQTKDQTLSEGKDSIAIGAAAKATKDNALAVGAHAKAEGKDSTAMGYKSTATGADSFALGREASAKANNAFAMGASSEASGENAYAMGSQSKATGKNAFAMGGESQGLGENALAIGGLSTAKEKNSIAVGVNAKANYENSVALGTGAEVNHLNSIAIGENSKTSDYTTTAYLYNEGVAGAKADGGVSFGTVGNERRLQNVAAGSLDTDGVNVSQLKKHKAITDKTGNDIANNLGGDSKFNAETGAISAPNYKVGGNTYTTVEGALKATKTEVVQGDNIKVTQTTGNDGQSIYKVETQKDVNFDKVTVGSVVIDKTVNTIEGLSNKDLSAADFAEKGRAATEEQLKLVKDAADKTDDFAVKYDKNSDDTVNYDRVTLGGDKGTVAISNQDQTTGVITTTGGTQLTNVASAGDYTDVANASNAVNAGDLNNAVINTGKDLTAKGLNFAGNTGTAIHKDLGATLDIVGGLAAGKASSSENIKTKTNDKGQLEIELAKNLTGLESAKVGDVYINGSSNTIEGLSNKDLSAADFAEKGRAATEEQLKLVKDAADKTDDFAVKYDKNSDDTVNYDRVTLGGDKGTVAISNQDQTTGVITTTGGTQLTNVASAGDYTDVANASNAVNAGDLNNAVINTGKDLTAKGLNFAGNTGTAIHKDLGATLDIVGGLAAGKASSSENIKTKTNDKGQLEIELAKNLTGLESAKVGDVYINGSSNTIEGLSNKDLSAADFAEKGRAATEEQLKLVKDAADKTDDFAVKYDKNSDDTVNYDRVTLGGDKGTVAISNQDQTTGVITTTGGTQLTNVASAGDYTDVANASNAVNAGDLNNAVINTGKDLTAKGLNFAGNTGTAIHKDLGATLDIVGGLAAGKASSSENIKTKTNDKGQLEIELAKNLTGLESAKVGDVYINGSSNTIEGLSNKDLSAADFAEKGRAATEEQLKLVKDAADKTDDFAVKYDKNSDDTVNYDRVTLGGDKGTVAISNQDQTTGVITTTGGTQLTNVASAGDYTDVANASNAVNAGDLNNAVINTGKDLTAKGLNFAGNTGTAIHKDLGATLDIVGGLAAGKASSSENIKTKTNDKGQLEIELAKNLTGLESAKVGDVYINGASNTIEGLSNKDLSAADFAEKGRAATEEQLKLVKDAADKTDDFAVKYDKNSDDTVNYDRVTLGGDKGTVAISNQDQTTGVITTTGGTQLTNVASAGDYTDVANASNAVNAGDLNNAVINTGKDLTAKGLNFAGNTGTAIHKDLGATLDIVGGLAAGKASSSENIKTKTNDKGQLEIELAKNLTGLESAKVGDVYINGSSNTIEGLSNKDLSAADFAEKGRAATEEQLKLVKDAADKTDDFAVKYDKNSDDTVNYDRVTLGGDKGTVAISNQDQTTGVITTTGGTQLTNVASAGDYTDVANASNAVNAGDLNNAVINTGKDLTEKGLNFAGNSGEFHRDLGEKVTIKGKGEKADDQYSAANIKTIADDKGNITIALDKDFKTETVTTNQITLTGKDGLNGTDGLSLSAQDGKPGLDGKDGNTRIVYKKPDGTTEEVATLNDGLKFKGNQGSSIEKKLNQELEIVGGLADDKSASSENITTVNKDGKLEIQLAKNLTGLESVTVEDGLGNKTYTTAAGTQVKDTLGNTTTMVAGGTAVEDIHGNRTTVSSGVVNIKDNNGTTIVNGSGLTINNGPSFTTNKVDVAGNKVINVAAGTDATDAVNVSQLEKTGEELTAKGLNFAGNSGEFHRDLGEKVTIKGEGEKADDQYSAANIKTIADDKGNITIALDKDFKTETVTTNQITLTGKDGLNGTDGLSLSAQDGKPGLDGKDGNTRIVYKKPDGTTEEVATLNDGLKFKGNQGESIDKKLNQELEIVGSLANDKAASSENITTVNKDGKLEIQLAKNLTGLESLEVGNTTINNNGLTINNGPSITVDGINAGNKVINNVAAGKDGKDAVNVDQLKDAGKDLTVKGLDFAGNSGEFHRDLGEKVTIKGEGEKADDQYSAANIKTIADDKGNITIALDKDFKTETVTTNQITLTGKDGLNGTDGLSLSAQDGKPGLDGKDGNTRIVYKKPDGTTEEVATLNDGLKFKGNQGESIDKKLNQELEIVGGLAKGKSSSAENITTVNKDGKLEIQLAKNLTGLESLEVGNTTINNNGLTIKNGPSITTEGVNAGNKIITNVANGTIAKDSTDAVNGGQIQAIADNIRNNIKKNIGGNTTINDNGDISTTNLGGTGTTNVHDAILSINKTAKAAKTEVVEGDNIEVTSTTGKDGQSIYTVATKKDLNLDSVTIDDGKGNITVLDKTGTNVKDEDGDESHYGAKGLVAKDKDGNSTILNQNGLSFINAEGNIYGPSITAGGINAGNTIIMNVANGVIAKDSKDAVNGGQISDISNSIGNSIGGETVVNNDGTITTSNVGNTGKNNIHDAIDSIRKDAETANSGWNVATENGKASNVKPGDTVTFKGDDNIKVSNDGNNVTVELAKDLNVDSITTGDTSINDNGLTIAGGPSVTKDGIDAGGKTITGVDSGLKDKDGNKTDLAHADGNNAVNVDDLRNTVGTATAAAKTEVEAGKNMVVNSKTGANGQTIYTVETADDVNFKSVTSDKVTVGNVQIDKDGINAGGQKVTNVADGTIAKDSKDAVNGGQLYAHGEGVKNIIGGNTTYNPETGTYTNKDIGGTGKDNINDAIGSLNGAVTNMGDQITNLGDRMEQVFYDTNKRIDNVEKKANAGIAAAMAMESAPFVAGKYTYAAGAAYHGGENAIGVTLRKTSDNGRWSITGGVAAASQGDPSVRIGISGVID
ncbi:ESPR-type extended signal peptide-containing protein [Acinetobacter larvae]|uniref:Uncharacterized protein n=1 Tax=Acinetobacter larvae TaxID=1789224 RepID=A0A1B2LY54_9GAMM|nr:ESPR-type extended signal peptide-containing protein [Acinetobacter larvae]AOA57871.1 hypothetical protein BFG52_05565 [Acinetobacter larvae]